MTYTTNADFDIRRSDKQYLDSPEKFMVCRGTNIFLRILGVESRYELMTATAGEDDGKFSRVGNQPYLIETALRVAAELGTKPQVKMDHAEREYVTICIIEYISDAFRVSEMFFEKYDEYNSPDQRSQNDMHGIYETLVIDDSGHDVYLSDGVWLSSDGSIHDRGR